MWIRLKVIKDIDRAGRPHRYQPGDWVDVGKQTALLWLTRNEADIPKFAEMIGSPSKAGIVIQADVLEPHSLRLNALGLGLPLQLGLPQTAYERTMIWNPQTKIRPEMVYTGFSFLENWEVACPLCDYRELASTLGSAQERIELKKVIRDLRVPVYNPQWLFVRRCANTERLIKLWQDYHTSGRDERLAFLQAFYEVKPLLLALPTTWLNVHYDAAYA